jgi:acyl carrier protein
VGTFSELSNQTIQDRVLKVIATSKRIPLESVQPDSSFESLGIDSLDRLNLLFDLESEFEIEINDEEAKQVQNIHEMIEGVTKLVEAKPAPSPSE